MEEMVMRLQYAEQQRERWRTGDLVRYWYSRYPELFDDKDFRNASNQSKDGYHFFEWLSAILIYESTGYKSLVEQYEFKSHVNKRRVLQEILPEQVLEVAINHKSDHGNVQCPDLLVYSPDYSDWFFCEVKGPRDRVQPNPEKLFQALAEACHKPVRLIKFESLKTGNKYLSFPRKREPNPQGPHG